METSITTDQYKAHIGRQDLIIPSPDERFRQILEVFKNQNIKLHPWDLVCFCTVYLTGATVQYPFLNKAVKDLTSPVYTAHYNAPVNIGILGEDEWHTLKQALQSNSSNDT